MSSPIKDIDFWNSKPVQFVGIAQSNALFDQKYTWNGSLFRPTADGYKLLEKALYITNSVSFTCDIEENIYKGQFDPQDVPRFNLNLSSNKETVFRQPFLCPQYYSDFSFVQIFDNRIKSNPLELRIRGNVGQDPAIADKEFLTAIITVVAYEVTDAANIKFIKEKAQKGGYGPQHASGGCC